MPKNDAVLTHGGETFEIDRLGVVVCGAFKGVHIVLVVDALRRIVHKVHIAPNLTPLIRGQAGLVGRDVKLRCVVAVCVHVRKLRRIEVLRPAVQRDEYSGIAYVVVLDHVLEIHIVYGVFNVVEEVVKVLRGDLRVLAHERGFDVVHGGGEVACLVRELLRLLLGAGKLTEGAYVRLFLFYRLGVVGKSALASPALSVSCLVQNGVAFDRRDDDIRRRREHKQQAQNERKHRTADLCGTGLFGLGCLGRLCGGGVYRFAAVGAEF